LAKVLRDLQKKQ